MCRTIMFCESFFEFYATSDIVVSFYSIFYLFSEILLS